MYAIMLAFDWECCNVTFVLLHVIQFNAIHNYRTFVPFTEYAIDYSHICLTQQTTNILIELVMWCMLIDKRRCVWIFFCCGHSLISTSILCAYRKCESIDDDSSYRFECHVWMPFENTFQCNHFYDAHEEKLCVCVCVHFKMLAFLVRFAMCYL